MYEQYTAGSGSVRRTPRAALALALAGALAACVGDAPLDPARADGAAPSLTVNAVCADSLGGLTHTLAITSPVTWARADNPHRVNGALAVTGGGRLTMEPGVLVCFGIDGEIEAASGGRVRLAGLDTARIVLTAADVADGWKGMLLRGDPDSASVFRNVRWEYTRTYEPALSTSGGHAALVDSAVVRQSARAFVLWARGSRVSRSRVDTTTNGGPAISLLADSTHLESTTILGAAGQGLSVWGTSGLTLTGVRILESGDIGMVVDVPPNAFAAVTPVRVTGGASYGAGLSVTAIARLYPQLADQDSLLGNARDTLMVVGGTLRSWAYARAVLPWRVLEDIVVESPGILRAQPGSLLIFATGSGILARTGGRVLARGTHTARVRLTAAVPDSGWDGISLLDAATEPSKFTNVQIEHVGSGAVAVDAQNGHVAQIDSAVLRQNGVAAVLGTVGSSIRRTRVDTTTSFYPAVLLTDSTTLESTRVRDSNGHGILVASASASAQILSCDVSGSAGHGVYLLYAGTVRDCNLAGNGGDGLHNQSLTLASAEDVWWGDAAGPTGAGGDGVSGNVDYTPWRTSAFTLPYVP